MSTTTVKFTPTEQRILDLLSDGMRHTREEVHSCLVDDLGPLSNIRQHMTNLRKKLNPQGTDIVCQNYGRKTFYRHVRLLVNPNDGKR